MNKDTKRAYDIYLERVREYNEVLEHLKYLSTNDIITGYKFDRKINKMIKELTKYKDYYTKRIDEINKKYKL